MTQTVYITKGLPACGKSSLGERMAKDNNKLRLVSKDAIRKLLYGDAKWNASKEPLVISVRDAIIHELLGSEYDVFVHDTNLTGNHVERISEIAGEYDAEVAIIDMTTVPVIDCIKRDALRADSVGYRVILGMAERYLTHQYDLLRLEYPTNDHIIDVLYKQRDIFIDFEKDDCIVVDIDGTVALMGNRSPYDFTKVIDDFAYTSMARLIRTFQKDYYVIYLSGREVTCYPETLAWLQMNDLWFYGSQLFMRDANDNRDDTIVKEELYLHQVKDLYNVIAWFDDRNKVVAHMRKMGLPVYQVNYGNF